MRGVLAHIADRAMEFSERPLFAALRSARLDPLHRRALMPYVAHFALTFADMYRFVLPERRPRDAYREWMNQLILEDKACWTWFASDVASADADPLMHFTDTLRFVWSDATVQSRLLQYRVARLAPAADSPRRFVLVHAIAAAAGIALESVGHARRESVAPSRRGDGAACGSFEVPTPVLEPAVQRDMNALVDEAFFHFSALADEAFAFGERRAGVAGGDAVGPCGSMRSSSSQNVFQNQDSETSPRGVSGPNALSSSVNNSPNLSSEKSMSKTDHTLGGAGLKATRA